MRKYIVCLFISGALISQGWSQAPLLLNYQGRLVQDDELVNGHVGLSLRLYNQPVAGSALYEDSNTVAVVDGLYSTFIGDHPASSAFRAALTNSEVYLEVAVNGVAMSPRERIVSVGYALATYGLLVATNGSVILLPTGENDVQASALFTLIGGGRFNKIGDNSHYAIIAGGENNKIELLANRSVIGGGSLNLLEPGAASSVIAGGGGNVMGTNATIGVISGGLNNKIASETTGSIIAGGFSNEIEDHGTFNVVGGGMNNRIMSSVGAALVAGGSDNMIQNGAASSVIAGGFNNRIDSFAQHSFIAGGHQNIIGTNGYYTTIGGGAGNRIGESAQYALIAGGFDNHIGFMSESSVIGGGNDNSISNETMYAVVDGGLRNRINFNAHFSVIGGGENNSIMQNAQHATLAGGRFNVINTNALFSAIGGGSGNVIGFFSRYCQIGGGFGNEVEMRTDYSVISGGRVNIISSNAWYAVIPGGWNNEIGPRATNALAAGRRAKAQHIGAFVWGDFTNADVASTNANSVTMRASGGYRLFSDTNLTLGVELPPNATAWAALSDREAKENITPIDPGLILERVADLPLSEWNYKQDSTQRRYIGPMAQDFQAAFNLGDGRTISTLDTDGVALAAIQGLYRQAIDQRMETGNQISGVSSRLSELEKENAQLREELESIKRRIGL